MPRLSLTACVQRCAIPFSFHSRELTKSDPCTTTAHEAQTTQTVYQLPFGAIREDPKGLAASYALDVWTAALFQALVQESLAQQ